MVEFRKCFSNFMISITLGKESINIKKAFVLFSKGEFSLMGVSNKHVV